jgi:hypothetical protein
VVSWLALLFVSFLLFGGSLRPLLFDCHIGLAGWGSLPSRIGAFLFFFLKVRLGFFLAVPDGDRLSSN